ncbi:NB-ARC domain-containing protein [Pseudofrankia sp. BMG5.36]|uniref:NB-ARC domain-containing protein n=1 Tax=Pseudofrankia sp. BMG5.36 TaxID=1834512 RepID=UPI0008D906BF|nr:NB-ARC domain-containing protein [Pseudofrankia sp. BMG5.36]
MLLILTGRALRLGARFQGWEMVDDLPAAEVQAFARMFPDQWSANRVLASIGFPREHQPGWAGGLSAVDWWSEVFRQLAAGKVVNGRRRLLDAARREFSGAPIFASFEAAEEGAGPRRAIGQRHSLRAHEIGASAVGIAAKGRRMAGLPVPYPNDKFVPRPAVEEAAVRALADVARGSQGLIVALTGMSGSGKTLSAQHVANDPRVREKFPDGVWWLDARDFPSATSCQAEVFRVLGELPPDSIASFKPVLQERLTELRCLIVLDNLVSEELIGALDVVGRDGAILVTTTDREIVPYGAVLCEVQNFDLDGSYQLLSEYSRSESTVLTQDAAKVVGQCGGLPLALAICGAMVGSGHGWGEVASLLESADLGALKQRFRGYPNYSLLAALEIGVGVLAADDRAAFGDLVVFAGCGPVPVVAAWRVWSRRGLSELQSLTMIRNLSRRSLLTYRNEDATFALHELLYQYLLSSAGEELPQLHAHLAQTYLRDWGGLDAALPSAQNGDEYGLTHLAFHLEHAGLDETLHRLLALEVPVRSASTTNRWFAVLEEAGWSHHYLADIDRAWRCARRATDRATEPEELASSRALEMHYALVTSSVVGIAVNVPTPLLSALVQRGVWSFATAWAYCGMVADPLARARALAALARLPAPPGIDRALLFTHASVAAAAVNEATDRAWAFSALIPCVPAEDRPTLFEAAMAATGGRRRSPVWLLARLARHVPYLVRHELLTVARSEDALATDISALVLASRWLPELRSPLRARIAELRNPHWRMCLLLSMLSGASGPERSLLLADAQSLAVELNASVDKTGAAVRATGAADGLTGLLDALLSDRGDNELRLDALRTLLAELPKDDQPDVIDTVVTAVRRRGPAVNTALARLALSLLPAADRPALTHEIIGEDTDVNALCTLAPFLPHRHLARAVDLACRLTSKTRRGRALDQLAPHLPVDLLRHALQAVLDLDTPAQRAEALVRLAPHLTAPGRQQAFAAASEVDDPDTRVDILADLVTCLPSASLSAIADAVPPGTSPLAQVTIFSALTVRARGPLQENITTQLLDAARAVPLSTLNSWGELRVVG